VPPRQKKTIVVTAVHDDFFLSNSAVLPVSQDSAQGISREMIREGPTVNPNPKPKTLNMAQAGDDAVRVFTRTGAASSEVPEGKEDVRSPETAPAPSGGVSQPLEGKTAGWCLAAEVPQVCPPIGRERVY
jgi:hypothetical protein